MSQIDVSAFEVSLSTADVVKVRQAIIEISNSMARRDAELEHMNEIRKTLKEEFSLNPKDINRLAKAHHKGDVVNIVGDAAAFQSLWEQLFGEISN